VEMPRLGKSVISVVRLEKDSRGDLKPVVLYKRAEGRVKKESPGLKALDKGLMRVVRAQQAFLDSYVSRHDNSKTKKADGWAIDLAPNILEAGRVARKKLKLNNLPLM
jgi:hypothetical protein